MNRSGNVKDHQKLCCFVDNCEKSALLRNPTTRAPIEESNCLTRVELRCVVMQILPPNAILARVTKMDRIAKCMSRINCKMI